MLVIGIAGEASEQVLRFQHSALGIPMIKEVDNVRLVCFLLSPGLLLCSLAFKHLSLFIILPPLLGISEYIVSFLNVLELLFGELLDTPRGACRLIGMVLVS